VLSNPAIPFQAFELRELELAARSLKVQLEILEVRAPRDLAAAHSTAKKLAGALFSLGGSMFFVHRARIVALAVESRLPALYRSREYPEAGGLMSYGVNLGDNYRRAAAFVDRILKGTKPLDLPVEQPTKFELVINRASRES
jgi:putative ABC transport system substrate-binding protein